jgi:hypothetical protein
MNHIQIYGTLFALLLIGAFLGWLWLIATLVASTYHIPHGANRYRYPFWAWCFDHPILARTYAVMLFFGMLGLALFLFVDWSVMGITLTWSR